MYIKHKESKKPAKRLLLVYCMLSDLFDVFIGYVARIGIDILKTSNTTTEICGYKLLHERKSYVLKILVTVMVGGNLLQVGGEKSPGASELMCKET